MQGGCAGRALEIYICVGVFLKKPDGRAERASKGGLAGWAGRSVSRRADDCFEKAERTSSKALGPKELEAGAVVGSRSKSRGLVLGWAGLGWLRRRGRARGQFGVGW